MNLIADEIVELLSSHDYGISVTVTRSFDATPKTFPRIIVRQMQDATLLRDAHGEELSVLAFQIEVYTKDCVDSLGNVVSRDSMSDNITQQVDDLMYEQYRMNRDDVTEIKAYSTDVTRRVMRYSCAIDKFGYTYRSSRVQYGGYTFQNNY